MSNTKIFYDGHGPKKSFKISERYDVKNTLKTITQLRDIEDDEDDEFFDKYEEFESKVKVKHR
jgi:lipid II:glycine glycyltransferase (peptidoglycan interpeptide bridge formation enzyme)